MRLGPAGPRLGGAVRRRLWCSAVSMKARWRPWSVRLAGVSGNLGADVGGQRRKRGTGPAGLAGSAGQPARPEAFGCRAGPGQAPRRGTYDLKRHACRGTVPPAPTHRSPNLNRYVPHRGRSRILVRGLLVVSVASALAHSGKQLFSPRPQGSAGDCTTFSVPYRLELWRSTMCWPGIMMP